MKTGLRLLLCACLLTASACAQDINYATIDAPLKTILDSLASQANYSIGYSDRDIAFTHVRFSIVHGTLNEAFNKLREEFPLRFSIDPNATPPTVSVSRYPNSLLTGRVLDRQHRGIPHLTISVVGKKITTTTNDKGFYSIVDDSRTDTLKVTGVNINDRFAYPEGRLRMDIEVIEKIDQLPADTISRKRFYNGYNYYRPPQAPPVSAYGLDETDIGRIPVFDPLAVLPGQASGLMTGTGATGNLNMSIHGTSTIFASRDPLVLFDKFPLDANRLVVNHLDLEYMDVLKDPASSVLWGALSGNGVIVLVPRTGQNTGKKACISFDANLSYTAAPDPRSSGGLDPATYASLEQRLYDIGAYDAALADPNHPAVPPITALRDQLKRGLISPADAAADIQAYTQHSSFDDLRRWYLRSAIRQQYHIGVSSGDSLRQHYYSFGYDDNPTGLTYNGLRRFTFYDAYDQRIGRFHIGTRLQYANIRELNNNTGASPVNYTYADLSRAVNYAYLPSYTDTAGGGRLFGWNFVPNRELSLADNSVHTTYYAVLLDLSCRITDRMSVEAITRFMTQPVVTRNHYSQNGFYMHDLLNRYTDLSGPEIIYAIPIGDFLLENKTVNTGQYYRALITYTHPRSARRLWWFSAQLGTERSELATHVFVRSLYGYDPVHNSSVPIDAVSYFPDYITGAGHQIPYDQSGYDHYTRYLAWFGDLRFYWKDKWTIYLATKRDGTNIAGVDANRKAAPFMAGSVRYDPWRHSGDSLQFSSLFIFRAGGGTNGNIGSRTGHLVVQSLDANLYGAPQNGIANAPDPELGWEQLFSINAGLDFHFLRDRKSPAGRIQGSLDLYLRKGSRILGYDSLPPSFGLGYFFGNIARIRGHGADLVINTENIRGRFKSNTRLLLSYTQDRITQYSLDPPSLSYYVTSATPRAGYPINSLYSFRNTTLDPYKGSPRGYLDGQVSTRYNDIINNGGPGSIAYSGSFQPAVFGSILNSVSYDRWTLSVLLTLKAFFVIRRPSIDYFTFSALQSPGIGDYKFVWKKPGDEKNTSVPAPPDSVNDYARSQFYAFSGSLITRGDYLRLQDIQIRYDLLRGEDRSRLAHAVTLYLHVSQPCLLWRANHYHLDPEAFTPGVLQPMPAYTLGVHMEL